MLDDVKSGQRLRFTEFGDTLCVLSVLRVLAVCFYKLTTKAQRTLGISKIMTGWDLAVFHLFMG